MAEWYNNGDWSSLAVHEFKYALCDLFKAVIERQKAVGRGMSYDSWDNPWKKVYADAVAKGYTGPHIGEYVINALKQDGTTTYDPSPEDFEGMPLSPKGTNFWCMAENLGRIICSLLFWFRENPVSATYIEQLHLKSWGALGTLSPLFGISERGTAYAYPTEYYFGMNHMVGARVLEGLFTTGYSATWVSESAESLDDLSYLENRYVVPAPPGLFSSHFVFPYYKYRVMSGWTHKDKYTVDLAGGQAVYVLTDGLDVGPPMPTIDTSIPWATLFTIYGWDITSQDSIKAPTFIPDLSEEDKETYKDVFVFGMNACKQLLQKMNKILWNYVQGDEGFIPVTTGYESTGYIAEEHINTQAAAHFKKPAIANTGTYMFMDHPCLGPYADLQALDNALVAKWRTAMIEEFGEINDTWSTSPYLFLLFPRYKANQPSIIFGLKQVSTGYLSYKWEINPPVSGPYPPTPPYLIGAYAIRTDRIQTNAWKPHLVEGLYYGPYASEFYSALHTHTYETMPEEYRHAFETYTECKITEEEANAIETWASHYTSVAPEVHPITGLFYTYHGAGIGGDINTYSIFESGEKRTSATEHFFGEPIQARLGLSVSLGDNVGLLRVSFGDKEVTLTHAEKEWAVVSSVYLAGTDQYKYTYALQDVPDQLNNCGGIIVMTGDMGESVAYSEGGVYIDNTSDIQIGIEGTPVVFKLEEARSRARSNQDTVPIRPTSGWSEGPIEGSYFIRTTLNPNTITFYSPIEYDPPLEITAPTWAISVTQLTKYDDDVNIPWMNAFVKDGTNFEGFRTKIDGDESPLCATHHCLTHGIFEYE